MARTRMTVLGAGLVGRVLAADLAADPSLEVQVVDGRAAALRLLPPGIATTQADLSSSTAVADVVRGADVVVGAVPGALGEILLEGVIQAGRPLVDVSFTPRYPQALDEKARRQGLTVVADCGLAPGLSNLLVGMEAAAMSRVDSVRILVGGLPTVRRWPFAYAFVFSPADVIEEYTRPARLRQRGGEVVRQALSEVEMVEFPGIGTLEAFNTDGLRSLLSTIPAADMVEKTLRYPGHAAQMLLLREAGFFSTDPITAGGVQVSPRQLTEAVLRQSLQLRPGESEFTVLRVEVEGESGGSCRRITWDLLERTDAASGQTSMARATAFPCALVARTVAAGRWRAPGIHFPEHLAREPGLATDLIGQLRARGLDLQRHVGGALQATNL